MQNNSSWNKICYHNTLPPADVFVPTTSQMKIVIKIKHKRKKKSVFCFGLFTWKRGKFFKNLKTQHIIENDHWTYYYVQKYN